MPQINLFVTDAFVERKSKVDITYQEILLAGLEYLEKNKDSWIRKKEKEATDD